MNIGRWVVCLAAPLLAAAFPALGSGGSGSLQASDLRLVPFPKQVEMRQGGLRVAQKKMMIVVIDTPVARQAAEDLRQELALFANVSCNIKPLPVRGEDTSWFLTLSIGKVSVALLNDALAGLPSQSKGYRLVVSNNFAAVGSQTGAGLVFGIQTLRQLIRANMRAGTIPCLTVQDYPSLRYRGFLDDITRGLSSKLELLQYETAIASFLKMNFFTYYLEYQYAFSRHPTIGPREGSLTPEDLKVLVQYAARRGVEIIGNQQSFGHMSHLLGLKEFQHLQETRAVLSPVFEETYQLLDDLYSEQIPLLPSEFFNVCCDETVGLGQGPSKPLADKIGVGGVYAMHINRVHDILRDKYGKRMMMWADIIAQHPDNLKDIPQDIVLLSWGYDDKPSWEEAILPISRSGHDFFVCPGMQCWGRILPDYSIAVANIRNYVRDGAKLGALGMLNTSWDDHGDNLMGYNWYLVAWGAECAWNASVTPEEDFNRRIGAVLFGETGGHYGKAIELLSKAFENPRYWDCWRMGDPRFFLTRDSDLAPIDECTPSPGLWFNKKTGEAASTVDAVEEVKADAQRLLDVVNPALTELHAAQNEAKVNADQLDFVIFGAERMKLMASRAFDRFKAADFYAQAQACSDRAQSESLILSAIEQISKVRDQHLTLKEQYRQLRQRENRPWGLTTMMDRFDGLLLRYDTSISAMWNAIGNLKGGRPLPSAADVGL